MDTETPKIRIQQKKDKLYINIKTSKKNKTYTYDPELPIDMYYQHFLHETGKTRIKKYKPLYLQTTPKIQPKKTG